MLVPGFPLRHLHRASALQPLGGWQAAQHTSRKPSTEEAAPLLQGSGLCAPPTSAFDEELGADDKQSGCYSTEGQQASAVMIVKY